MGAKGGLIIGRLLRLAGPLAHLMALCILLGALGFFAATAITVLAANLLLMVLGLSPWSLSFAGGAAALGFCAVVRGLLRYGEQMCGHYIAFKLLAIIRDKVFGALRRLAPAKLEGRGRGDLISLITGDIELLEVFYAHTIAPVCIAFLVSLTMSLLIGRFHPLLGLAALASYGIVGCVIPLAASYTRGKQGVETRHKLGALNSYFLESLRGIRETRQFGEEDSRARETAKQTEELNRLQGQLKKQEGAAAAWSAAAMPALTIGLLLTGLGLKLDFPALLLAVVMLSASFGPVLALASLSATLAQTLASGERVLALLEEEAATEEIIVGQEPGFSGAKVEGLSFSYGQEKVLDNLSVSFPQGAILGVSGKSGSGKSTLLKLLMRFWRAQEGRVLISGHNVEAIPTAHLRSLESYMIQETDLFHDSIGDNIRIGKLEAGQAEVEAAAQKASLHEFIMTLPQGYDTPVGELGETLSGGERQRIGLARAFLHDAPFMLLDEPTSNLDSLNEGVVLKALQEHRQGKTVVLVSHRQSTLAVADWGFSVDGAGGTGGTGGIGGMPR